MDEGRRDRRGVDVDLAGRDLAAPAAADVDADDRPGAPLRPEARGRGEPEERRGGAAEGPGGLDGDRHAAVVPDVHRRAEGRLEVLGEGRHVLDALALREGRVGLAGRLLRARDGSLRVAARDGPLVERLHEAVVVEHVEVGPRAGVARRPERPDELLMPLAELRRRRRVDRQRVAVVVGVLGDHGE